MRIEQIDHIIFDIDGTLTPYLSWMRITWGLAQPGEKKIAVQEHKRLYRLFKNEEIDYPEFKQCLLEIWQKTGNANYEYMVSMFRSWCLKDDAVETIDHLKHSYSLCLMSGAVDLFVKVVAEQLEIEDWYANTDLKWDMRGNLIDFHFYPNGSKKKVEQLFEYCREKGIDWERCAIVGDGDTDYDLFQILLGIAINALPDERLEHLAYYVIKELSELKDIFPN